MILLLYSKIKLINMNNMRCKFGLHKYEIYKEETLTDIRENVIGKIIISRCELCGKIHIDKVYTVDNF